MSKPDDDTSKIPATQWHIDPLKVHDTARLIARELDACINGRRGNSAAHQKMYETYKNHPPSSSFTEAAETARAMWVAGVIFEMLNS
jgi:hypothetical protein